MSCRCTDVPDLISIHIECDYTAPRDVYRTRGTVEVGAETVYVTPWRETNVYDTESADERTTAEVKSALADAFRRLMAAE